MFFLFSCLIEPTVIAVITGLDICLSCLFEDVQGEEYILIIFVSPALNTMPST